MYDLHRILGLMTERQWDESLDLARQFGDDPILREATVVVADLFSPARGRGEQRLLEYRGALDEAMVRLTPADAARTAGLLRALFGTRT